MLVAIEKDKVVESKNSFNNPYNKEVFLGSYYKNVRRGKLSREQADWIVKNLEFSSVIDVGVGSGDLLKNFSLLGKKVFGVEYSKWCIDNVLPKDLLIFEAPVWDMSVVKEGVDLITCFDVLHFIPMNERVNAVKELNRLCKRYLLLNIPCNTSDSNFRKINEENWVLSKEEFDNFKKVSVSLDLVNNLLKDVNFVVFEDRSFWKTLFEKYGFKEVNIDKYPPDFCNKHFFIFEKINNVSGEK